MIESVSYIYLSCDKGNKGGINHFVKILSWYDKNEEMVCKFTLDVDGSDGKSEDCALAVQYSLRKVGSPTLSGLTTDSGGGGVLESLGGICVGLDVSPMNIPLPIALSMQSSSL